MRKKNVQVSICLQILKVGRKQHCPEMLFGEMLIISLGSFPDGFNEAS